jgi:kynurenine 3-monooxygenase
MTSPESLEFPTKPLHVIVVGGGLVGSLASLYFSQKGHKTTLIEKRKDIRKVTQSAGKSINLALSVRGMEALKMVGIEIEEKIAMKARMIHSDEKLMSQAYGVNKECIYSVDRKLINQILLDKCQESGVEMLFDTGLEFIDFEKMVVTTSFGTRATNIVEIFEHSLQSLNIATNQFRRDCFAPYHTTFI